MTTEARTERYRKVAEKELAQGNPRDPVLNESIEAAAKSDSDVTAEYAKRRTEQMLADEKAREEAGKRLTRLQKDHDEGQMGVMIRTLTLIAVIVAVVAMAYALMQARN